jgi:hypothetical protein
MCVLLALATPMLVVFQGGIAAAAPPANDSIENATVVGSLPYSTTQNWSEATADPADPQLGCNPFSPRSVWLRYDATSDALVRANAGVVAVAAFEGSPGDLNLLGCGQTIRFNVQAGHTYYVMVMPASGLSSITVNLQAVTPPANDVIEGATLITTVPTVLQQLVGDATASPSDPPQSCVLNNTASLWFRYEAPATALLRVSVATNGSSAPVAVYEGAPGSLTGLGCGTLRLFNAEAGHTYYFMVLPSASASGIQISLQAATPPANDLIENATPISALPYTNQQSMVDATRSGTDPLASCGGTSPTAWYRYDALSDAPIRVTTTGGFGALATFVGTPDALTEVACGTTQRFSVVAGSSYYIAVLSSSGPPMTVTVRQEVPPANDLIENATLITSFPFTDTATSPDATRSPDDPFSCVNGTTLWYRYDAPADGVLKITSSNFSTAVVYEGTPGSLTELQCGSSQPFPVSAGSTYYIMVSASLPVVVPTVTVQLANPPANDLIGNAAAFSALPYSNGQSIVDSTHSASDPSTTCGTNGQPTVWYRYDALADGFVRASVSSGTVVSFEGAPGNLTELLCGGIGGAGTHIFHVTAGSSYYFMIVPFATNITFNLQPATPPANDAIENATPVSLPFQVSQSTVDATRSESDPFAPCFGNNVTTVWYRYDASATQRLRMSVSTSTFTGGIILYEADGDAMNFLGCVQSGSQDVTVTGGRTYYFMGTSVHVQTITFGVQLLDTLPTIVVPDDITVEATSPSGAVVDFTVTASDEEDGDLVPQCSASSGSEFSLGDTTVECSATDAFGLTTHASFTVHVVDTTAPVLSAPGLVTVDATSPTGAVVSLPVSATDVADASPIVVCTPPSDSAFPMGDTSVSCVASDASGNSSSANLTVHVKTATEQLQSLKAGVSAATSGGLRTSLTGDLASALAGVSSGNTSKACGALTDFVGHVRAQSGKAIPVGTAQAFIDSATRIKAVIGCKK